MLFACSKVFFTLLNRFHLNNKKCDFVLAILIFICFYSLNIY